MDARSYSFDSESATATDLFCCDVDEEYIPKAGMTFPILEVDAAFYKKYAKRAGFATKIRNTNRCRETKEIKNQLITCNREGKWIFEISYVEKTNPTCGANCPARIYVHIVKKTKISCISKVVLHHSHPCCPDQAQMLPQHRELRNKALSINDWDTN
ncbi:hypothetical protein PIB30_096182 [Stylosanthes scabra]|uniref:FAR1 domain-containing protein n=1 Tax=Stylosanthes scabra TaxID=79078 RepID=A0ABU6TWT1_9FABA|nr:hypothetical protein [Stylosanthes scabra]